MVLPDKHIRFSESLLGLGALVLESLDVPKSIDALWNELHPQMESGAFPARHTFDNLVLAADLLYAVGTVTLNRNGRLVRCALSS
jgi:hypothetical protein